MAVAVVRHRSAVDARAHDPAAGAAGALTAARRRLLRAATAWPVVGQERAARNALSACQAMTAAREEREEVEAFLARLARNDDAV